MVVKDKYSQPPQTDGRRHIGLRDMANFGIKYLQYCSNVILFMLRPCIYAVANIIINI